LAGRTDDLHRTGSCPAFSKWSHGIYEKILGKCH
jgi:hypothetical protein